MTSAHAASMTHLPPFARLLLPVLQARAKGHPECWATNATLARVLGCCERTIQVALDALRDAKLIETLRDYTLRSRRRILLLFARPKGPAPTPRPPRPAEPSPSVPRPTTAMSMTPCHGQPVTPTTAMSMTPCHGQPVTPAAPELLPAPSLIFSAETNSLGIYSFGVPSDTPDDTFVGANKSVDLGADSAPSFRPPLEPPFMGPEGNTVSGAAAGGAGGDREPPPPVNGSLPSDTRIPEAEAGVPAVPCSPINHAPQANPTNAVDPEVLAEMAARAAKLCGNASPDDPSIRGRIRALLARWGPTWLAAALGRAETRSGRGTLENPFGYLEGALRGFQADGGPPPPKPREPTVDELNARDMHLLPDL